MAGSRYHRIGNLATHPAFSHRHVALVCPLCGTLHQRVPDYDRDFLAHQPTAEQAWRRLSGRRYEREAPRRGWSLDPGDGGER